MCQFAARFAVFVQPLVPAVVSYEEPLLVERRSDASACRDSAEVTALALWLPPLTRRPVPLSTDRFTINDQWQYARNCHGRRSSVGRHSTVYSDDQGQTRSDHVFESDLVDTKCCGLTLIAYRDRDAVWPAGGQADRPICDGKVEVQIGRLCDRDRCSIISMPCQMQARSFTYDLNNLSARHWFIWVARPRSAVEILVRGAIEILRNSEVYRVQRDVDIGHVNRRNEHRDFDSWTGSQRRPGVRAKKHYRDGVHRHIDISRQGRRHDPTNPRWIET